MANKVLWAIAALLLISCSPSGLKDTEETESAPAVKVKKMLDSFSPDKGIWGTIIIDLTQNDTLLMRNANLAMPPASLTKLFTVWAAEKMLIPEDFASVHISPVKEESGSVDTLYWQGVGLPLADTPLLPDSLFSVVISELERRGITKIDSAIVVYYPADEESLYPGWTMEDLVAWYAPHPSLSIFADNLWYFKLSGTDSLHFRIDILPDSPYAPETKIYSANRFYYRWNFFPGQRMYLKAGIGADDTLKRFFVPMLAPEEVWMERFRRQLSEAGFCSPDIEIVFSSERYGSLRDIAAFRTVEKDSLAKRCLKYSDNLIAEALLRSLGLHEFDLYSRRAGLEVLDSLLREENIMAGKDYLFWDGSGLSRYNLVTPAAVAALLKKYYHSPKMKNRLAETGKPGTLKDRLVLPDSGIGLKGKTGSLRGVRNFAGFLKPRDGGEYLVVMMAENFSVSSAEIDELMKNVLNLLSGRESF
jgi:D-alanyl-D-alanine carboxypeptidase/D-alanyl-D-alanine-endopeptidase (penicillin-binding protein 4)